MVKVNNSVLTEEDLDSALSDKRVSGKYREEYIQSWIETEVLFQKAEEEGITDNFEFKSIVENSRKKLAASMLLQKLAAENTISPTTDELKKFYSEFIGINQPGVVNKVFRILDLPVEAN